MPCGGIRQAIQRGFADAARTIRLPVHVLEMLSKLSRVERDMHQRLGREPTPEELAVELDRTPDQIEELLRTSRQPISLDSTIGEDGETSIGDLIEDVDTPEASELVDRQLMADQLRNALDALTPREATIMAMRFGLRREPAHAGRDRARARPHQGADPPAGEAVPVQAAPPQPRAAAAGLRQLTQRKSWCCQPAARRGLFVCSGVTCGRWTAARRRPGTARCSRPGSRRAVLR